MAMDDELDIGQMLADCEIRSAKLNDWECGFIDSISIQFAKRGHLTHKQSEQLNTIWEKVTAHG